MTSLIVDGQKCELLEFIMDGPGNLRAIIVQNGKIAMVNPIGKEYIEDPEFRFQDGNQPHVNGANDPGNYTLRGGRIVDEDAPVIDHTPPHTEVIEPVSPEQISEDIKNIAEEPEDLRPMRANDEE